MTTIRSNQFYPSRPLPSETMSNDPGTQVTIHGQPLGSEDPGSWGAGHIDPGFLYEAPPSLFEPVPSLSSDVTMLQQVAGFFGKKIILKDEPNAIAIEFPSRQDYPDGFLGGIQYAFAVVASFASLFGHKAVLVDDDSPFQINLLDDIPGSLIDPDGVSDSLGEWKSGSGATGTGGTGSSADS